MAGVAGTTGSRTREDLAASWCTVCRATVAPEKPFCDARAAPLVQFGGFNFGPPPEKIGRSSDPLLLSWVANNYWDTNFPQVQSGPVKLRYGLLTLARPDQADIAEQASKLRSPVLIWPVTAEGRPPSAGRLRVPG